MSTKSGFEYELYELGLLAPMGCSIGLHIRFASPLMVLESFPKNWTDHYTNQAYALRDPITGWGFSTSGVTRWSELEIPDPFNVYGQAADFGLKYGVSVSVGPLSSKTIGSAARSDREFTDAEIGSVKTIIERLHHMTEPPERLTSAQAEALNLIAEGFRHSGAAAKLQISESALKARLTAARNKLLARTTVEAIKRARDHRLL